MAGRIPSSPAPPDPARQRRRRRLIAAAALVGLILAGAVFATLRWTNRPTSLLDPRAAPVQDSATSGDWQNVTGDLDLKVRDQIYREALSAGEREIPDWPASAEQLIVDFWQAAHDQNFYRMSLLCPGSQSNDYSRYFTKWKPSPAKQVGAPERHAKAEGVLMYPVRLDFPLFANKTVKMAVRPLPDGRLIIDGQYTIWW